jgi:hypothetical protein
VDELLFIFFCESDNRELSCVPLLLIPSKDEGSLDFSLIITAIYDIRLG